VKEVFLPRNDIDKFQVHTVGDVWCVFDDALITGGDVGPPKSISIGIPHKSTCTHKQTLLMQTEPLKLRPRPVVSVSSAKLSGPAHWSRHGSKL
jgi:hypothetical protein